MSTYTSPLTSKVYQIVETSHTRNAWDSQGNLTPYVQSVFDIYHEGKKVQFALTAEGVADSVAHLENPGPDLSSCFDWNLTETMKLFIINNVLSDYTSGMVVIAAESKEQCRELFIKEFSEYYANEFDQYATFNVIESVGLDEAGIVNYVYGGS